MHLYNIEGFMNGMYAAVQLPFYYSKNCTYGQRIHMQASALTIQATKCDSITSTYLKIRYRNLVFL